MELHDITLPDDLEEQIERLGRTDPGPGFALSVSRFHKVAAQDWTSRRGIKKLIHPDNARVVIPHLPGPGERTHCALSGNFVLCDIIPAIIEARGRCPDLLIATLGMSVANADTLVSLRARDLVGSITIVCSHYFAQVDKATTFREIQARLRDIATIVVTRSHAKIICLPVASGDHYVLEGSANLRTSDNTEQLVIFNDSELAAWHRTWLSTLPRHG